MHDVVALEAPNRKPSFVTFVRAGAPTLVEASLVVASALLSILSFPDFDLWFLAWFSLVPLLVALVVTMNAPRAFVLGWLWGTIFFYGTCWWLTFPMIHYGHIPKWLAFPLLMLPVVLVAAFSPLFLVLLARLVVRFGLEASFAAPLIWVFCESIPYALSGRHLDVLRYFQA